MNKIFLIILLTISFNANAGWFEDLKKKVGIGYQSYDDCIIGEMKDIQNNNKTLQRAIANNCRKKFPLPPAPPKPKKIYKTLFLPVESIQCLNPTLGLLPNMNCRVNYTNDSKYTGWGNIYFRIYDSKSPEPKQDYNLKTFTKVGFGYNFVNFNDLPSYEKFYHLKEVKVIIEID